MEALKYALIYKFLYDLLGIYVLDFFLYLRTKNFLIVSNDSPSLNILFDMGYKNIPIIPHTKKIKLIYLW